MPEDKYSTNLHKWIVSQIVRYEFSHRTKCIWCNGFFFISKWFILYPSLMLRWLSSYEIWDAVRYSDFFCNAEELLLHLREGGRGKEEERKRKEGDSCGDMQGDRSQLAGVSSFLLSSCGSWRPHSAHQAWWQTPLPIELSCCPTAEDVVQDPQYVLLHNCIIGILKLYLSVLVFCLHVCLYITCMSGANVGSLRWKLQIVICHVGAGN